MATRWIANNFTESEFECNCGCGQLIIKPELVSLAQNIRDLVGRPVLPHSVNRCPRYNKIEGGKVETEPGNGSQHLYGKAMDFHVVGMSIKELHRVTKNLYDDKIIPHVGYYDWGVHIDIRSGQGYWGELLV